MNLQRILLSFSFCACVYVCVRAFVLLYSTLFSVFLAMQDTGVASVNFPICSRSRCIDEYQHTPCGSLSTMLKSQPEVADLLISLFYVAASTQAVGKGFVLLNTYGVYC